MAKNIEAICLRDNRPPVVLSENEIKQLIANEDEVAIFEALASVDPKTSFLTSICFNLDCNRCQVGLFLHDSDEDLLGAMDNKDVVIPVTCCVCETSTNIGLSNIEFELVDIESRRIPNSGDFTHEGYLEATSCLALYEEPLDAEKLIALLEDGRADWLKMKAAEVMAKCAPDDVVEALVNAIQDPDQDYYTWETAAESLLKLGSQGEKALGKLADDSNSTAKRVLGIS